MPRSPARARSPHAATDGAVAPDAGCITLRPAPARWRTIISQAPIPPAHASDRAAVGLPTDRPVVLSGHQPTLWHAGILAKLLAACELAASTGAAVGWIVPDADEADP